MDADGDQTTADGDKKDVDGEMAMPAGNRSVPDGDATAAAAACSNLDWTQAKLQVPAPAGSPTADTLASLSAQLLDSAEEVDIHAQAAVREGQKGIGDVDRASVVPVCVGVDQHLWARGRAGWTAV